jgi:serine/threonine protein kinase
VAAVRKKYVEKPHSDEHDKEEKESQMLAPNTLLQDRYLVMRLLGQGGMGAVYQATDRKFGNAVALKETFYNDIQLRKAFSQEARLLNRLRHAALPVVTDYFAIGDRQFLVMQYIPGMDLEQLLAERRERGQGVFLTTQVLRWADQLLDALEYLHSQKPPIIHRDIKPQNLKLTPRGEVILLDFGLAKGITNQPAEGGSQSIRGYTPNYASLEQIRGTGTDARSDIYSIGATLYHLLTGQMPQDAMTRIAAMLMGQSDPLPQINELNSEVQPAIAAAIEKAMSPHPDQRYQSAAMMRQALRNASRNAPDVSFHRTPTILLNGTMNNNMAVAAAAVNYDGSRLQGQQQVQQQVQQQGQQQRELAYAPQAAPAKPAQGADSDHVIILLDEGKQPLVRNRFKSQQLNFNKLGAKTSDTLSESRIPDIPNRSLLAGVGLALAVLFIATGVFLFLSRDGAKSLEKSTTNLTAINGNNSGETGRKPEAPTPIVKSAVRVEALRYYLELDSAGNGIKRTTGFTSLAAGSKFRFHFKSRESGYLYLVALGKSGNVSFLTAQPIPATGVKTNRLEEGRDFKFPDAGNWFEVQPDSDKTPFIVIFSPNQLTKPAFLAAASGRNLNDSEQKELDQLRKSSVAYAPDLVETGDKNTPDMVVQISPDRPDNRPLVFELSLKKK